MAPRPHFPSTSFLSRRSFFVPEKSSVSLALFCYLLSPFFPFVFSRLMIESLFESQCPRVASPSTCFPYGVFLMNQRVSASPCDLPALAICNPSCRLFSLLYRPQQEVAVSPEPSLSKSLPASPHRSTNFFCLLKAPCGFEFPVFFHPPCRTRLFDIISEAGHLFAAPRPGFHGASKEDVSSFPAPFFLWVFSWKGGSFDCPLCCHEAQVSPLSRRLAHYLSKLD